MPLLVLDRDGVINEDSEDYIRSLADWQPIPGSLEAIARLTQAGYRVVVATNQSGVGRGLFETDTLIAIHDKMLKALTQVGGRIDAIFFCPHPADSTCNCRKPKPGMFLQIAERFNVELKDVPTVGDSLRDIEAGLAVGCTPYLVQTGKGKKTAENPALPPQTKIFPDLAAVARHLLLNRA